jgi:hypothetical protein
MKLPPQTGAGASRRAGDLQACGTSVVAINAFAPFVAFLRFN